MGQAEFKEKLGDRGRDKKAVNGFNTKSGTRSSKFHTSWEGTTKGKTKHIKPKG